jgi:hypothetical protein
MRSIFEKGIAPSKLDIPPWEVLVAKKRPGRSSTK